MSASVVYAVTEVHMSLLSEIAARGCVEDYRGAGRFLAAICPEVWPDMRIQVEELPVEEGAAPKVRLTRLQRVILRHEIQTPDNDHWVKWVMDDWFESEAAAMVETESRWRVKGVLARFDSERGAKA